MSNLQLRVLSALVLVPIVFGAIITGGLAFKIFVAIIFAAAAFEWIKLSLNTKKIFLFLLFGAVYLPAGFYAFYFIREGFENGLYLLLAMLLSIWAGDTGAYFVGRKFGKHKMAPTISPNKSWEGLGGCMIFSALILWATIYFAGDLAAIIPNSVQRPEGIDNLILFSVAAVLGYIGQVGDLIESALKRNAQMKDSGNIIPGHGGILDRVDSIILVSPVFASIISYAA